MRLLRSAAAVAVALSVAQPASAAVIGTTVTGSGSYSGDIGVLTDGIVPADGSAYNSSDKVFFSGTATSFTFDFGGEQSITSLLANVDNNDNYVLSFYNGSTLVAASTIFGFEGSVGNGVETFVRTFAPITATSAVLTANGGDNLYGLGEVRFEGVLAAVPEPGTWLTMLLGFGAIGAASRRQRKARLAAA